MFRPFAHIWHFNFNSIFVLVVLERCRGGPWVVVKCPSTSVVDRPLIETIAVATAKRFFTRCRNRAW